MVLRQANETSGTPGGCMRSQTLSMCHTTVSAYHEFVQKLNKSELGDIQTQVVDWIALLSQHFETALQQLLCLLANS